MWRGQRQAVCSSVWVDVLLGPGACRQPRRAADDRRPRGAARTRRGRRSARGEAREEVAACDWRRRRPRLLPPRMAARARSGSVRAECAAASVEVDGGAELRSRRWSGRRRQRRRRRVGRSKRGRKHCRPLQPVRLRSAGHAGRGTSPIERVFGSRKTRSTSRLGMHTAAPSRMASASRAAVSSVCTAGS